MGFFIILLIIIGIIVLIAINCIRIVPQTQAYVIERLGAYQSTWGVGVKIKYPIIDKIAAKVSLKEQTYDFPPQPVITKDNITMAIDAIVFCKIVDPKLYTYGVHNPTKAIEHLTTTTLRNIIGELDLDETLTSRDVINAKMTHILDEATDAWGIKIMRVEIKNINPPQDIREAMEKQMRAERERRELILQAEGEKKASVLRAEGQKESQILKAEGEKSASILAAEAEKESKIRLAEGEAESILKVQEAVAQGLEMINKSSPTHETLILKGYETLEKVADGQATKLIVPSNLQDLTSITSVVKESFSTTTPDNTKK